MEIHSLGNLVLEKPSRDWWIGLAASRKFAPSLPPLILRKEDGGEFKKGFNFLVSKS